MRRTTRLAARLLACWVFFRSAAAHAAPLWQRSDDSSVVQGIEPAPFDFPRRTANRPVRVFRFRFWADADYRGVTPRWQMKARAWLSELSRLLEPSLGVRFEAESFHNWDRGLTYAPLPESLLELIKTDAGNDVDFVVGLVSALPHVSLSADRIGQTDPGRRHLVLRAMGNLDDARMVYRRLPNSDVPEEDLYARRVLHRELVIFLHEWAHAMGAPHVGDPRDIMYPSVSSTPAAGPPHLARARRRGPTTSERTKRRSHRGGCSTRCRGPACRPRGGSAGKRRWHLGRSPARKSAPATTRGRSGRRRRHPGGSGRARPRHCDTRRCPLADAGAGLPRAGRRRGRGQRARQRRFQPRRRPATSPPQAPSSSSRRQTGAVSSALLGALSGDGLPYDGG